MAVRVAPVVRVGRVVRVEFIVRRMIGVPVPRAVRALRGRGGRGLSTRCHRTRRATVTRQALELNANGLLRTDGSIEFHARHAARADRTIQHPRDRPQVLGEGARPSGVRHANLPGRMPELRRHLCTRRAHQLTDPRQRQHRRVVMHAQLRGRELGRRNDVRLRNALSRLQVGEQPADTAIGCVGHLGEDEGNVDAKRVGHGRCPRFSTRWPVGRKGNAKRPRTTGDPQTGGWIAARLTRSPPVQFEDLGTRRAHPSARANEA